MEKLLQYLNTLTPPQRLAFCALCGTTEGYLRKAISTGQKLGESLCILLEKHSADSVSIEDLRPDLAATLRSAQYQRPNAAIRRYTGQA